MVSPAVTDAQMWTTSGHLLLQGWALFSQFQCCFYSFVPGICDSHSKIHGNQPQAPSPVSLKLCHGIIIQSFSNAQKSVHTTCLILKLISINHQMIKRANLNLESSTFAKRNCIPASKAMSMGWCFKILHSLCKIWNFWKMAHMYVLHYWALTHSSKTSQVQ